MRAIRVTILARRKIRPRWGYPDNPQTTCLMCHWWHGLLLEGLFRLGLRTAA